MPAARAVPDPYVSVIVTAHGRRRYLPDALRSLERQTLDKEKFEVVVVKNFEDPVSDEIIRRNAWKNIVTDIKPLGGKLAIGMEESKGEIITFLEDDDMYIPERLQVVEKKFREIRGLAYFHNAQVVVDEEGNVVPPRIARPLMPPSYLGTDLVVNERIKRVPCSLDYVKALTGADFNNSSIAVRRSLLGPHELEAIWPLTSAIDSYLYTRAFVGEGLLYLSVSKLTMYRVHLGTPSGYLVPWTASRYLREGRLQILKEQLRIARLLRAIATMKSASTLYELATKNCGPYNSFWQHYINGRYDWITYSQNPLSIGRVSLPDLLRAATILAFLNKNYYDLTIRLSKALMEIRNDKGNNEASNVRRTMTQNWLAMVLSAASLAVLKYLLQFSPRGVKEKYLNLSLKLELRKSLKNII